MVDCGWSVRFCRGFAGTDAAYKSTDPQPPKPFFYFPTVVAPITVSYNLSGVKLNLSPETAATSTVRSPPVV